MRLLATRPLVRAAAAKTNYILFQAPAMGARFMATQADKKQGGGNGLVLGLLAAAGVAGGFYYNSRDTQVTPVAKEATAAAAAVQEPAFSPKEFRPYKLEKVEQINHNTSLFRFALPSEDAVAGLPVASCVITRYPITKKDGSPGYVIRPYTPTSTEDAKGYVDFIVKVYPEGKMSKHIHNLKPGDTLDIKGPIPKYNWDEGKVDNVGMIAGGTGITPMLQIIRKVFDEKSGDKNTKVTLIFANQTEEDILLKEELDGYAKSYPDRFKVVYALDRPPKNWDGVQGYVSADVIKKYLPPPETENYKVFICGPDPMLAAISGGKAPDKSQGELSGILKELGFAQEKVYKF